MENWRPKLLTRKPVSRKDLIIQNANQINKQRQVENDVHAVRKSERKRTVSRRLFNDIDGFAVTSTRKTCRMVRSYAIGRKLSSLNSTTY
jgi:hypothetical protein